MLDATKAFSLTLRDADEVAGLPESLRQLERLLFWRHSQLLTCFSPLMTAPAT